jgi:hypothetical protein
MKMILRKYGRCTERRNVRGQGRGGKMPALRLIAELLDVTS